MAPVRHNLPALIAVFGALVACWIVLREGGPSLRVRPAPMPAAKTEVKTLTPAGLAGMVIPEITAATAIPAEAMGVVATAAAGVVATEAGPLAPVDLP